MWTVQEVWLLNGSWVPTWNGQRAWLPQIGIHSMAQICDLSFSCPDLCSEPSLHIWDSHSATWSFKFIPRFPWQKGSAKGERKAEMWSESNDGAAKVVPQWPQWPQCRSASDASDSFQSLIIRPWFLARHQALLELQRNPSDGGTRTSATAVVDLWVDRIFMEYLLGWMTSAKIKRITKKKKNILIN
jgi:hypothetical protein